MKRSLRFALVLAVGLAALPAARAQNYQQLAAQMDALADQCHAQYVQEMRDSNSSAASRDLAAEQKYRLAAVNIRAQAANAGGGAGGGTVGGGYSAPLTGNQKVLAAGQIITSGLANMAAIMQESEDQQKAAAQAAQQQAQADQLERDWQQQIEEGKRELAEQQRQFEQQQQLNAAHAQYGSFYNLDDAPAVGSPATGAGGANYDPVADVLGNGDGTGYGHHEDALVADVLGGSGGDQPGGAGALPVAPTDHSQAGSIVDLVLGSPAAAAENDQNSAENLAKAGIHPATILPTPGPNTGTGVLLLPGPDLTQGPAAEFKLDRPLDGPLQDMPDWFRAGLLPPPPTNDPIRTIPPTPDIKLPVDTPVPTP